LPGAVPEAAEADTSGALVAPLGPGDETPLFDAALKLVALPELDEGAIFPGVALEGATCGDEMAPVGAGDAVVALCARAMPVVISKAVEASQIERMIIS
jgi:hypothetical protein